MAYKKFDEAEKMISLNILSGAVLRSGRSLVSQRSVHARIRGRRSRAREERDDSHADYITAADHPSTGSEPDEQKACGLV